MFKGKLVTLIAAACVTGVCSAGNATPEGISGGGSPAPQGISGSGSPSTVKPYCLILGPFGSFCFV